jgi:PTS system cellobiose-specific IIB component
MIRIMLFCTGGCSTSFLVQKIKTAMVERGVEGEVSARAEAEFDRSIDNIDVVLLAPQARFMEKRLKQVCQEKKKGFAIIDNMTYGRMDGKAALDLALKAVQPEGGG